MKSDSKSFPLRPAWMEIDLGKLRRNLQLIRRDLPPRVKLLAVVKDEAYGHGALDVARVAVEEGAWGFGLSTLEEAMTLRDGGITAPLLLLGERQEAELEWCVAHDLTVCVNEPHNVRALAKIAAHLGKQVPVHVKIHTGMSRYGVRWDEALPLIERVVAEKSLLLEGVMTHFSQSDETDKTFANLQLSRFQEVLRALDERKISVKLRHVCNSGGFLDLPHAHLDMVRTGILMYGIFPSQVCRRIDGIEPVMSVKARIAAIQTLKPGEVVGYGMRYTATTERRHRRPAHRLRRRFPARAQRRRRAHPWPARAAHRRHRHGRADGGHHGYSTGANVGRSRPHGPPGRRRNHRARHREAEELGDLRRADELAFAAAAKKCQCRHKQTRIDTRRNRASMTLIYEGPSVVEK